MLERKEQAIDLKLPVIEKVGPCKFHKCMHFNRQHRVALSCGGLFYVLLREFKSPALPLAP